MSTLLQLALSRPALLTQHARGYAALIAVEAEAWAVQARLRLLVAACMVLLLAASLTLAGVGTMLWPLYGQGMQAHALPLLLAPTLPLLGAVGSAVWLRTHPQADAFPALRQQIDLDIASLQEPAHAES
jgi:hypothetical protein